MAVPKFDDFLYPFLTILKEGDKTTKQMRQALAEYFHLSEDDLHLTTKGGNKTQLKDRMDWIFHHTRRAKCVENANGKRGVYHLTDRGREFIESRNTAVPDDMLIYPEYADYTKKPLRSGAPDQNSQVEGSGISTMTPTEMLQSSYDVIVEELADTLLACVLSISPKFFEHLVVDLLLHMGYGDPTNPNTLVTQYSHDDGIDGIIPQDRLGLDKIYVQAKRYNPDNKIGKPQLHQFSGAINEKKANKGVFITTSSFSEGARNFVRNINQTIVLIDGQQLARLMIEYNVGVSIQKTYEVKRIDSDYFTED